MAAEVVIASGKSYCRGGQQNCLFRYPTKITKGSKALVISIYGAGGGCTAFYCAHCMISVLQSFEKALADA